MNSADAHIEYLADCPAVLETLAAWHHGEWAAMNPGDTLDKRCARLRAHLQKRAIPTTFVALTGQAPLGSASLVDCDLHSHSSVGPWLASVFVAPAQRHRGLGRQLVRRVVQEAADLGVPRLYLFTPDREQFYAHMGWVVHERTHYLDRPVVIMAIEPRAVC